MDEQFLFSSRQKHDMNTEHLDTEYSIYTAGIGEGVGDVY